MKNLLIDIKVEIQWWWWETTAIIEYWIDETLRR